MRKGAIIGPDVEVNGTEFFLRSSETPPDTLRQCALYCDHIAYPTNNIIHVEPSRDVRFLIQEGLATNVDIEVRGNFTFDERLYSDIQIKALEHLLEDRNTDWTIAQNGSNLISTGHTEQRSIIESEFYRMLPVPSPDTPIQEIIDFKGRRSDLLFSLREEIEDMTHRVQNDGDTLRERNRQIERLEAKLDDIHRCMNEQRFSVNWQSLKMILSDPWNVAAGAAGVAAAPYALPLTIAGFGAAMIRTAHVMGSVDYRIPKDRRAYAYLAHAIRDLDARPPEE
ncbi:DUF6236 family protein [Halomonas elongata]|uniref:DUF6236 family protein n=1 Tax=Halomonas elongata TaxID=2746 RepID=UPI0033591140